MYNNLLYDCINNWFKRITKFDTTERYHGCVFRYISSSSHFMRLNSKSYKERWFHRNCSPNGIHSYTTVVIIIFLLPWRYSNNNNYWQCVWKSTEASYTQVYLPRQWKKKKIVYVLCISASDYGIKGPHLRGTQCSPQQERRYSVGMIYYYYYYYYIYRPRTRAQKARWARPTHALREEKSKDIPCRKNSNKNERKGVIIYIIDKVYSVMCVARHSSRERVPTFLWFAWSCSSQ